jgi:prephenate dehydrogenase
MKRIAVVGMGIIGGSIAGALTRAGYQVDGFSRSQSSVDIALEKGYIAKKAQNLSDYDVVFIAVPPKATLDYLDNGVFKDGALVTDICGVKKMPEEIVYKKQRNYRYVGIHPMAGKETSGINSATPELFKNANIIITIGKNTQKRDIDEIKEYIKAMQFGKIVECSAEEHDKKIALTSQLAHIVSNAYVKSPEVHGCDGFTGGSFQDMTRIAGVDETVWTPLYACNRANILGELEGIINHLRVYYDALKNEDDTALSNALKEGRLIRETIRRKDD